MPKKYFFSLLLLTMCTTTYTMQLAQPSLATIPDIDFKQHTCAQLRTNFNCLKNHQKADIVSQLSDHQKMALLTALQLPEITHRIIRFMTYDDEQTALLFSTMPFAHALVRLCRIEEIFKLTNNFPLLLAKKRDVALSAYFYFGPYNQTKILIGVEKDFEPSIPNEMYEILKKYKLISEKKCYPIFRVYSVCDPHAIPMPENPEDRDNPCVII